MNHSSRLKLMLPTNADAFTPQDFTDTFTILDAIPGVTRVANYAGLPTNLTNAYHGSLYLQMDNRAMWMWNQPTTGGAGSWVRTNSLGFLGGSPSLATKVTYSQATDPGATVLTASATAPGGRYIMVTAHLGAIATSDASGITKMNLLYNGTSYVATSYINGDQNVGTVCEMSYIMSPPAAGTAMTFKLCMRPYHAGSTQVPITSSANPTAGADCLWIHEL